MYIEEIITTIESDFDYSPVVVHSNIYGILFTGDNIHNVGWELFADGYEEAIRTRINNTAKMKKVFLNDLKDVEDNKEILEESGDYQELVKLFKQDNH